MQNYHRDTVRLYSGILKEIPLLESRDHNWVTGDVRVGDAGCTKHIPSIVTIHPTMNSGKEMDVGTNKDTNMNLVDSSVELYISIYLLSLVDQSYI